MVQADQCLKHLDESAPLMVIEVRSIVQVFGVTAYFWVDSATSVRGGNLGFGLGFRVDVSDIQGFPANRFVHIAI